MSFSNLFKLDIEIYIWTVGLIVLVWSNPEIQHFTLCPIANLGYDWCPGCGLGRSISLLFKGRLIESLEMHPLGIFAVIILSYRIVTLFKTSLIKIKINHEQDV